MNFFTIKKPLGFPNIKSIICSLVLPVSLLYPGIPIFAMLLVISFFTIMLLYAIAFGIYYFFGFSLNITSQQIESFINNYMGFTTCSMYAFSQILAILFLKKHFFKFYFLNNLFWIGLFSLVMHFFSSHSLWDILTYTSFIFAALGFLQLRFTVGDIDNSL